MTIFNKILDQIEESGSCKSIWMGESDDELEISGQIIQAQINARGVPI